MLSVLWCGWKIKLQAMEEAQTKIFNSLTDAASKATDSVIGFLERWNQTKLTTSQIEAVTKAVVDYREAMKAAEAEQDPLKKSTALSLAKSNLAGKVTAAGLNYPDMSRAKNAQEAYYMRPLVESFDKILDGLRDWRPLRQCRMKRNSMAYMGWLHLAQSMKAARTSSDRH